MKSRRQLSILSSFVFILLSQAQAQNQGMIGMPGQPMFKPRPDQYQCNKNDKTTASVSIDSGSQRYQLLTKQSKGALSEISGVISSHSALTSIMVNQDVTLNAWTYLEQFQQLMTEFQKNGGSKGGYGFIGGGGMGMGMGMGGMMLPATPPGGWGTVWGVPAPTASRPQIGKRAGDMVKKSDGNTVGKRAGDLAGKRDGDKIARRELESRPGDDVDWKAGDQVEPRQMEVRGGMSEQIKNLQNGLTIDGRKPVGARAGDVAGPTAGAAVTYPGVTAFSAKVDAQGNLVEVVYRDGNSTPKHIQINSKNPSSTDPVFLNIQGQMAKLKSYSACCVDDKQGPCDVKYAPPETVQALPASSEGYAGSANSGSPSAPNSDAYKNPFGGAPAGAK